MNCRAAVKGSSVWERRFVPRYRRIGTPYNYRQPCASQRKQERCQLSISESRNKCVQVIENKGLKIGNFADFCAESERVGR